MTRNIRWAGAFALVAFTMLLSAIVAQDTKEPKKSEDKKIDLPKAAAGKTYKVEKGPFRVQCSLKGTIESDDMTEVAVSMDAWLPAKMGGPLTLAKALDHGAAIKKGDPILWLDTDQIDQTIRDMEAERSLTELALNLAQEELPLFEKAVPLDQAAAERSRKQSDEDLKHFLEKDKAQSIQDIEQQLKLGHQFLEYAKEELKQLEKMYRAKDMTEETEEIILKRQRNDVERIQYAVKRAERQRDRFMDTELPRREKDLQDQAAKSALLADKTRQTLPLSLQQKRLQLEKLKYDREKVTTRLDKLKRDREAMTVKAPCDGVLYHGKFPQGSWGGAQSKLNKGSMIQPNEVLLTIVKTKPIYVRAVVEEKDLHLLQSGLRGTVVPTAHPDMRLIGKLAELNPVPVKAGTFEARIALDDSKDAASLMPGMACTVKFTPYKREDAIAVPSTAVFSEELDDDARYVYLAVKEGKPEKRSVEVGRTSGTKTEIVKGLQPGDAILLKKPDEQSDLAAN